MSYFFNENKWNERFIDEVNRSDFITMKSADHFDRYLDINFWEDDTLYTVIGSDSGLLIPYILSRPLGKASRIVLIEPDEIYHLVYERYAQLLQQCAQNQSGITISLHPQSTWQQDVFDGTEKKWLMGGIVRQVESRASRNDYTQVYTTISRQANEAVQSHRVAFMLQHGNGAFTANQLINAADNIYPLKRSEVFGKDKTAIVLGGSPSLDQHLDWIVENRDCLFIAAVSRICAKLFVMGLKPDVVVSIDPKELSYDNCKHGLLWDDVPLIHNYHVAPKLLQEWRGPTFYLGRHLPWQLKNEQQANENIASTGPTVSHAAVLVCSQLGFTTILMSGVDFCYSESVSTHEKDSHEAIIQKLPSLCDAQLETYDGRVAGTTVLFQRCAYSMEEMGKAINQYAAVLFNLSKDAAKCPSIPLKNILDVQLPTSKPDFNALTKVYQYRDPDAHLDNLSQEVTVASIALRAIKKRCIEAIQLVNKAYDGKVNSKQAAYIHKLNKLEKRLEKESGRYLDSIKHNSLMEFALMTPPREFKDMSNAELKQWGYDYYKVIQIGADKMIKLLLDLQQRILIRQCERAQSINVPQLLSSWEKDNTHGRVLKFKSTELTSTNASDCELIDLAVSAFQRSIHAEKNALKEFRKAEDQDINNSMKSLIFLFNNAKGSELTTLHANLESADWPYAALQQFTAGLIAELNSDAKAALSHYQVAIDCCSDRLSNEEGSLESMQRMIEESLVRMTQNNINLFQYEEALSTMGTLCEILPQYIPSCAKLLNLCGNTEFAIELLEEYVAGYPANKAASVQLEDLLKSRPRVTETGNQGAHPDELTTEGHKPWKPDIAA